MSADARPFLLYIQPWDLAPTVLPTFSVGLLETPSQTTQMSFQTHSKSQVNDQDYLYHRVWTKAAQPVGCSIFLFCRGEYWGPEGRMSYMQVHKQSVACTRALAFWPVRFWFPDTKIPLVCFLSAQTSCRPICLC